MLSRVVGTAKNVLARKSAVSPASRKVTSAKSTWRGFCVIMGIKNRSEMRESVTREEQKV